VHEIVGVAASSIASRNSDPVLSCFFHLRSHSDGCDLLLNRSGRALLDRAAVERATLEEARWIISIGARLGHIVFDEYIDVEDEAGALIHSLSLADAVDIQR
jgi:hypothetical protein